MEKLQWTKRLNQKKIEDIYLKRFGREYREYRQSWQRAGEGFLPQFPVNLDLEVVDACNLRCRYCVRNTGISEKIGFSINTGEHFPLEVFKKVMAEGARYGLKAVNFGFSGECLLNPDLIEMIHIARQSGVLDIRLLTNGTLVTRQMVDKLLGSPLTLLSFSIDAGTAATYNKMKGKDCFDDLANTVEHTYRKRLESKKDFPLIRASFYPAPENNSEQDIFVERFKKHVDFIDFQDFYNIGEYKKHKIDAHCRAPFQRLAIFANGDVSSCCTFFSKKLIVGNINRMTLKEIWDSKAVREIRESMLRGKPVPVCVECLKTVG